MRGHPQRRPSPHGVREETHKRPAPPPTTEGACPLTTLHSGCFFFFLFIFGLSKFHFISSVTAPARRFTPLSNHDGRVIKKKSRLPTTPTRARSAGPQSQGAGGRVFFLNTICACAWLRPFPLPCSCPPLSRLLAKSRPSDPGFCGVTTRGGREGGASSSPLPVRCPLSTNQRRPHAAAARGAAASWLR